MFMPKKPNHQNTNYFKFSVMNIKKLKSHSLRYLDPFEGIMVGL